MDSVQPGHLASGLNNKQPAINNQTSSNQQQATSNNLLPLSTIY
jgi:hypothetical protein